MIGNKIETNYCLKYIEQIHFIQLLYYKCKCNKTDCLTS